MEAVGGVLGELVQTVVILFGIGVAWGSQRSTTKDHGERITKLENAEKIFNSIMISMARFEERALAMDARILTQGKRMDDITVTLSTRMDTQASLINSRLEAINNIVANHTNQLYQLRKPRNED